MNPSLYRQVGHGEHGESDFLGKDDTCDSTVHTVIHTYSLKTVPPCWEHDKKILNLISIFCVILCVIVFTEKGRH